MGGIIARILLTASASLLMGCPAKDWVKREDAYVSVEQYRTMTEVIRINDRLYRVKKGEELNQNQITQLFFDLQAYKKTSRIEQEKLFKKAKTAFEQDMSIFSRMLYVLILLDSSGNEITVKDILSELDYSTIKGNDKNLFNLAHLLHTLLQNNKDLQSVNTTLEEQIGSMNKDYELIREEVIYLNKQVNALKTIEESIHAREVGIEFESR